MNRMMTQDEVTSEIARPLLEALRKDFAAVQRRVNQTRVPEQFEVGPLSMKVCPDRT